MIVLITFLVFLTGLVTGAIALWRMLPGRLKHHIDYKQRWEEAITLLGNQGQLTDEQIAKIRGEVQPREPQPDPPGGPIWPHHRYASTEPSPAVLKALHNMASWDRKDAEIARARRGLPPLDDLVGMASWDAKDVLEERTRWG
jgi:hypothetical protein